MKPVITVDRQALYKLLEAFTKGPDYVINLCNHQAHPNHPVAILMGEFNQDLNFRQQHSSRLMLVKK